MRFAWDPRKAESNLKKHRASFEEATTVFADPLAVIVEDPVFPDRSLIVGQSLLSRVLIVVFLESVRDQIRIVSARRATKHERKRYEEGQEV